MNDITITHYRYKSSEASKPYHLAKDYGINPDKMIKERMNIPCYLVEKIDSSDIFPRGGVTVVTDELGNVFEAECSFNDNYDRRRGVNMCVGRLNSIERKKNERTGPFAPAPCQSPFLRQCLDELPF